MTSSLLETPVSRFHGETALPEMPTNPSYGEIVSSVLAGGSSRDGGKLTRYPFCWNLFYLPLIKIVAWYTATVKAGRCIPAVS